MIPILYEKDETAFTSNGIARLRDAVSVVVTEERNGLYEADFEYPVNGAYFDEIRAGRIIAVTHDNSGDIQPFDIVSYSRPINGMVTFHCVHISYRQSFITAMNVKAQIFYPTDAFDNLKRNAHPENPFTYETDITSIGYLFSNDSIPRTVRSLLGGIEGSILDTYGGEYEWDKWRVILHEARGTLKDVTIRYGVNLADYNEEFDSQETYSSVIPYWTSDNIVTVGNEVKSSAQTITGRGECIPLDVSDKFESDVSPTTAQIEAEAEKFLANNNTTVPTQSITVSVVNEALGECGLCDTVNVVFPYYGTEARYKIVKTEWNALLDRYESMELGSLSTSLSEALGINNGGSVSGNGNGIGGGVIISKEGDYGSALAAATSANPWTAPVSGIMVIASATSSGQRAYWYVTDKTDGTPSARATRLETGSYQLGASFPVVKGHEYYSSKAYLSGDPTAVLYRLQT